MGRNKVGRKRTRSAAAAERRAAIRAAVTLAGAGLSAGPDKNKNFVKHDNTLTAREMRNNKI